MLASGPQTGNYAVVGEKFPFHSLTFKKANRKRKLVQTPGYVNYPDSCQSLAFPLLIDFRFARHETQYAERKSSESRCRELMLQLEEHRTNKLKTAAVMN